MEAEATWRMRQDHLCRQNQHQRRPIKVLSGSHPAKKQPVAGCFALRLVSDQSDPHQQSSNDTPAQRKITLWGQLGEILGGVRFP
jgi:hypothetical protein